MKEGYLPLYRKYRPQKLEDIVGQTHIKTALANAINLGKISHAYLFTGPRGTGKTSTARILAKSLNCVNGPTVTPCNECESCKSITASIPIDVIEMDAASNRSVEDAHNILEKVQYAPVNGKYKIFIIDEVHMLTTQAFNALLKTLEEPPENVIFILATTESHKVLDTIKSRCQRFDFKRITTGDIVEHLKKIAKKENINISDGAIMTIAKSSAGGMRDSLALLDQVSILGASKEISEDDINNLLGRLSFEILNELAGHIVKSDVSSAIQVLERIYNNGNEPIQILTNLMMYFKNLLIVKTCDEKYSVELTGLTCEQVKILEDMKNSLETHQIVFLINKTAEYIKTMRTTTNQQMWMEVGLIDLANLADNTALVDLQNRLMSLESGSVLSAVSTPPVRKPVARSMPVQTGDTAPVSRVKSEAAAENKHPVSAVSAESVSNTVEQTVPDAGKNNLSSAQGVSEIKSLWVQILREIPSQADQALLALANPVKISDEQIVLTIKNKSFVEKANSPAKRQSIVDAAAKVLGKQSIPLLIREPLPEDKKIDKVKVSTIKKPSEPPRNLVNEDSEDNIQQLDEIQQTKPEQEPAKNKTETDFSRSDQSNMVRELFDGKFLD